MKTPIFYVLTLWILAWGGLTSHYLSGGTPFGVQWTLIATLFFGLARGPWAGQMMGLAWGLLFDAAAMGTLGVHTLLHALAGYSAGMLRRQLDSDKPWTQGIFTGAVSVIYGALFIGLDRVFSPSPLPLQWAWIVVPLINALVAPIVFMVLRYWIELWRIFPKEET